MATRFNYPTNEILNVEECKANSKRIREAADWFGIEIDSETEIDICDDGSVYIGNTQIMPRNSIKV